MPENVRATVGTSPTSLVIAWTAPTTGPMPDGYQLEFRDAIGTLIFVAQVGAVTSYSIAVPGSVSGVFTVSVRATASGVNGTASAPVPFTLGQVPPVPALAPSNFRVIDPITNAPFPFNIVPASRVGGTVLLTFGTVSGATGYRLFLRLAPTSAVLAAFDLPPPPVPVLIPIAPIAGVYCVTLAAVNSAGMGPISTPVSFGIAVPRLEECTP